MSQAEGTGGRVHSEKSPLNKGIRVVHNSDRLRILTGRSNPGLAEETAALLGIPSYQSIMEFPGEEVIAQIPVSVRKRDVFIIQPTSPPRTNTYHMELCFMIDAVARASANEITAIAPWLGYSRQDRQTDQQNKDAPRESISSKVVIDQIFNAGAHRLQTVDVHADQETGFVSYPFDNLYASSVLVPRIQKELPMGNLVTLSPDFGGAKRAKKYKQFLEACGVAVGFKERMPGGTVETYDLLGSVEGSDVLIIDDVLASGESAENAAVLAYQKGANSVSFACTHGLFLEKKGIACLDRLLNAGVRKIFVTNTIKLRPEILASDKVVEVSVAPLLARSILAVHTGKPIHDLVLPNNAK